MSVIGNKTVTKNLVDQCLLALEHGDVKKFEASIHSNLLQQKIRFPMLEYATQLLIEKTSLNRMLDSCEPLVNTKEIGANVIAGMVLQQYVHDNLEHAFDLAVMYITQGGEWYSCDIVAERVMGYALLHFPEQCLQKLRSLQHHTNPLAVRTIGVAIHYAVKKGLPKKHVDTAFLLLLNLANSTSMHVKTGIGWGAKTCAKFHPEVVTNYAAIYQDTNKVGQWFRTKLGIGFSRNYKYASRYTR